MAEEKKILGVMVICKGDDIQLYELKTDHVAVGRGSDNTVCIDSTIVSREQGEFCYKDGAWYYRDRESTNGFFLNEKYIFGSTRWYSLMDGSVIRYDKDGNDHRNGVLILFCYGDASDSYRWISLTKDEQWPKSIGRAYNMELRIRSDTISLRQGILDKDQAGKLYFTPDKLAADSFLNGVQIRERREIRSRDVLSFGDVQVLRLGDFIACGSHEKSNDIFVRGLGYSVKKGGLTGSRTSFILKDVNANIMSGELVAIMGASGAGKTTFVDCLIGKIIPQEGSVRRGTSSMVGRRKAVSFRAGYVPQDSNSTMRAELTVMQSAMYAAKMSLPRDTEKEEIELKIRRYAKQLGLHESRLDEPIGKLSGGQRTRASILQELITEPEILFLDEPTSGQDPATENEIIATLKKITREHHKTVVVITHTILSISAFDRIMIFGAGNLEGQDDLCGKLCYSGQVSGAAEAFNVSSIKSIYSEISYPNKVDGFAEAYKRSFMEHCGAENNERE